LLLRQVPAEAEKNSNASAIAPRVMPSMILRRGITIPPYSLFFARRDDFVPLKS
jgi:hypothetical protein